MPVDNVIPFTDRRPLSLAQQCRRAAKALEAARLACVEAERGRGGAGSGRPAITSPVPIAPPALACAGS